MSPPIIQTQHLNYRYGRQLAVEEVKLEVPAGTIYGFLGPNGAGKSTTIKLLLGLLRPTSGHIQLFGQDMRHHRRRILARVGALIEAPALYGELTARENLRWMNQLFRRGEQRIDEILELIDLAKAARKKVKRFSMGMKQRLGIGMALFHDPDLLILDEPVNGLDPAGIHEMRSLFHRLQQEGKTLLISSHILSEVEKTASHVGIIHQGAIRFQGTIAEMRSTLQPSVLLQTNQNERAASVLQTGGWEIIDHDDSGLKVAAKEGPEFHHLLSALFGSGIEILSAQPATGTLEDYFMKLTRAPEAAAAI